MTSQGLAEARRLLKAAKRKPDEADRPPPSTFTGRKPPHIAGQLSLTDIPAADERHEGEETSNAA
jgi:hypothetical protein